MAKRVTITRDNTIAARRPDLLEEWDWERNAEEGLDPNALTCGSDKKAWWKCPNHPESYRAGIGHRTNGTGCPYCSGRKVLRGFNDLESQHPELLSEWDWELNDVLPSEMLATTNKKAHWICKQGHPWEASLSKRVAGRGCPTCNRQKKTTRIVESARRRTKAHDSFVTEVAESNAKVSLVGTYKNARTPVEVECKFCKKRWHAFPGNILRGMGCDDCSHVERRVGEAEFVSRLAESNPKVRLVGGYTMASAPAVFECVDCGNQWEALSLSVLNGTGCPSEECVSKKISDASRKPQEQFMAELAEARPTVEIIGEYAGSTTLTTARCLVCEYEWEVMPSRLLRDTGCPQCAGNAPYTDETFRERVASLNPDIEVTGDYVNVKSLMSVKCLVCEHEWTVRAGSLTSQSSHTGCPQCAGVVRKTHEQFVADLAEVNDTVVALSLYDGANNDIELGCTKCGETWTSTPHRALSGSGCPECNKYGKSFFESFIYYAAVEALGKDRVVHHDKSAIGMELDVLIPDMSLAFEPGTWFYHKKRVQQDAKKARACKDAGIRLVGIYTGYDGSGEAPDGYRTVESSFVAGFWPRIAEYVSDLFHEVGIPTAGVDWRRVRRRAMSHSGRRTTRDFVAELAVTNPTIEVLGEYAGAREHVRVKCRECEREWEPIADSLLHGHGCKRCSSRRGRRKGA